jgi:hypothetical protein
MIDKASGAAALDEATSVLPSHLSNEGWFADVPPAFIRLLQADSLRSFVTSDLRSLLAGSPHGTKEAPAGEVRLYTSPDLQIRARIVFPNAPAARSVTTLARRTLLGNAGRSAFTVQSWRSPESAANDVFDPAARLERAVDVRLEPGEAMALHAGTDAYHVVAADRPAVALTAAGPPAVPLAWHYDLATLRPVQAKPARKEWLLLRELITFAGMIGDRSLLPALADLTVHPSHFIRWAAAKTAHGISPEDGRAILRTLSDDPHPQVRSTARQLLTSGEPR